MPNNIKYLKKETEKFSVPGSNGNTSIELLWGDRVEILSPIQNGKYKAKARGRIGFINADSLTDEPLLELYFIDVGQGDGILIITPDRKHILIDGGYKRTMQPHGKSAADFVDWKFFKDYGKDTIELDAMICSHCDADHYGGLWDLVNEDEKEGLDAAAVKVKNFYHAGVSWWKDAIHDRFLGREENGFLIDLLEGKSSIDEGLNNNSQLRLQGDWAKFIKAVRNSGASVKRLGYDPQKGFEYISNFEPPNNVTVKILGPILYKNGNKYKLMDLGDDSKNTNGNSILLRVDYGRCRILLTGDLNKKSHQQLLNSFTGNRQEFAADVVKSCHHGSDDCSYEFLECVNASATIISSGDDETHSHPRPNIMAASAVTGFKIIKNDELITPLVFSTEISRSLKLGDPYKIEAKDYQTANGKIDISLENEKTTDVFYKQTTSGGLNPKNKNKSLDHLKVVDGIIYGLVNVRTDGDKILCATLNEGKNKWEIKTFKSRF